MAAAKRKRIAKLSQQMTKFLYLYLEFGIRPTAWINSGHKVDRPTACVQACRALQRPGVQKEWEKLKNAAEKDHAWNRGLLLDALSEIVMNGNVERRDQLTALKEIGRIIEVYEPEKINVQVDDLTQLMLRIRARET